MQFDSKVPNLIPLASLKRNFFQQKKWILGNASVWQKAALNIHYT